MEKKYIIYDPNPGGNIRDNLYAARMVDLLSQYYQVVGIENISNDPYKLRQVKCAFLNWTEYRLNAFLKRRLYLYRLYNIKIFWAFHNRVPHDFVEQKQVQNLRWLANFCDQIILLSESSRKYLPDYRKNGKKAIYVPHINYIDAYPKTNADIRKTHGINEESVVFSFLGKLRPYKNIDLIIDAFIELDLPNAFLLIAGPIQDSRFNNDLLRQTGLGKRIIVDLGRISNGDMETYLRASDVLILPYNKTSSMNSGAMIMAFSYGRTVIIPRIAMAEDIYDEGIAFIYDYETQEENYAALKAEIYKAYNLKRENLLKMGKRAKDYMEKYNGEIETLETLRRAGILESEQV